MSLDEARAFAEVEAENNRQRFLARAEQMRRRHHKELHELNSQEGGARRARQRSVPSGPARRPIDPITVLALIGLGWLLGLLLFIGALFALVRWVWGLLVGGGV